MGAQGANPETPVFVYVHLYTTHGIYSFTSHPKDEAIVVKDTSAAAGIRTQESRVMLNMTKRDSIVMIRADFQQGME